jgi:predicted DNA-binding transcriptional regulator AlpA
MAGEATADVDLAAELRELRAAVESLTKTVRQGQQEATVLPLTLTAIPASKFLGVSRSQFYAMIADGTVPAGGVYAGTNRRRWKVSDLRRVVDRMRTAGSSARSADA